MDVNLDKLTPEARVVAEGISTTLGQDDFSKVRVRHRKTDREIFDERFAEAVANYNETGKFSFRDPCNRLHRTPESAEKAYKSILKMYGGMSRTQGGCWSWRKLKAGETPEEFLNAQVKAMLRKGIIVGFWTADLEEPLM